MPVQCLGVAYAKQQIGAPRLQVSPECIETAIEGSKPFHTVIAGLGIPLPDNRVFQPQRGGHNFSQTGSDEFGRSRVQVTFHGLRVIRYPKARAIPGPYRNTGPAEFETYGC